jgi:hypothetical protein
MFPAQAGIQSPGFYKPELFHYINPVHQFLRAFCFYEVKSFGLMHLFYLLIRRGLFIITENYVLKESNIRLSGSAIRFIAAF